MPWCVYHRYLNKVCVNLSCVRNFLISLFRSCLFRNEVFEMYEASKIPQCCQGWMRWNALVLTVYPPGHPWNVGGMILGSLFKSTGENFLKVIEILEKFLTFLVLTFHLTFIENSGHFGTFLDISGHFWTFLDIFGHF